MKVAGHAKTRHVLSIVNDESNWPVDVNSYHDSGLSARQGMISSPLLKIIRLKQSGTSNYRGKAGCGTRNVNTLIVKQIQHD